MNKISTNEVDVCVSDVCVKAYDWHADLIVFSLCIMFLLIGISYIK